MNLLKWIALPAVLAVAASGVEAKIIDCAIAVNASHDGWVMDREIIDYDVAAGTATVLDGMTQTYMGGPIAAKVVGVTQKKAAFSWSIQSTSSTGKQVNMLYRAAFYNDNKTMLVTVNAPGYSNKYEARGSCKVK